MSPGCRSARRLGADSVRVVVRSTFEDMKASPWEKEDAEHEGIPIHPCHVPKEFIVRDGVLVEHWALLDNLGMMKQLGALPQ